MYIVNASITTEETICAYMIESIGNSSTMILNIIIKTTNHIKVIYSQYLLPIFANSALLRVLTGA